MAFFRLSSLQFVMLFLTFLSVAGSMPTIQRRCFIFGCGDPSKHDSREGVSEDMLYQFGLFAQYSAAAYCEENNKSPKGPIACHAGNCPMLETTNVISSDEFQNVGPDDDTGFIAIDNTCKLIVLAFRGSVSGANWHGDFEVNRVHTDLCKKCHVHKGFWKAWNDVKEVSFKSVEAVMGQYPDYRFAITAHSLGGAIATLAAADFRRWKTYYAEKTELFTFGSPRIGNMKTAEFLTLQSTKSYRVTATDDPVPRLPWHKLGYFHMSPEYWIHDNLQHPSASDIKWVIGYYNEAGNSGANADRITHLSYNMESHRHYFGSISQCAPKNDPSRV